MKASAREKASDTTSRPVRRSEPVQTVETEEGRSGIRAGELVLVVETEWKTKFRIKAHDPMWRIAGNGKPADDALLGREIGDLAELPHLYRNWEILDRVTPDEERYESMLKRLDVTTGRLAAA